MGILFPCAVWLRGHILIEPWLDKSTWNIGYISDCLTFIAYLFVDSNFQLLLTMSHLESVTVGTDPLNGILPPLSPEAPLVASEAALFASLDEDTMSSVDSACLNEATLQDI